MCLWSSILMDNHLITCSANFPLIPLSSSSRMRTRIWLVVTVRIFSFPEILLLKKNCTYLAKLEFGSHIIELDPLSPLPHNLAWPLNTQKKKKRKLKEQHSTTHTTVQDSPNNNKICPNCKKKNLSLSKPIFSF